MSLIWGVHNPFADAAERCRVRWAFLALLLLALATLVPSAAAVAEAEASSTHPDVLRAWHEPADVVPGTQWHGYLQLRPEASPAQVGYQICNAGDGYCFAPTHDATSLGNGTYRFDTEDYLASNGKPVDWQAGWRIGVRWFLADAQGNGTWVPRAPPSPTEQVPIEDLYLTFAVPGEPGRGAAGTGFPFLATARAVAMTVLVRRRTA
jgi:hypothetical protein